MTEVVLRRFGNLGFTLTIAENLSCEDLGGWWTQSACVQSRESSICWERSWRGYIGWLDDIGLLLRCGVRDFELVSVYWGRVGCRHHVNA
jgi:hypothetical protein